MTLLNWSDVLMIFVIIVISVTCTYLLTTIRNLNGLVKELREMVHFNKDNLNEVLKNLPAISQNIAELSENAKAEMAAVSTTIKNINETTGATAAAAQSIKSDIIDNVKRVKTVFKVIDYVNLARKVVLKKN